MIPLSTPTANPTCLLACLLLSATFALAQPVPSPSAATALPAAQTTNYHGWPGSILLRGRAAEAVIVPAIGRVMQFKFVGDPEGPFWENRALDGKAPDPAAKEWGNFGGDKTWPAPQEDWPKTAQRGWPPPPAFDSMPVEAKVDGRAVVLISPVDPHYGIRTRRRIEIDPERPVMTISTEYEKVRGEPSRVSVWIITQLRHPEMAFALLPDKPRYAEGFNRQSQELPSGLKVDGTLLGLTRNPKSSHKIGADGGSLLWMDSKYVVRVDSARIPNASYPDQESSAEIYTNPDPLAYVELEMLGPLHTLKPGDRIERASTYTLSRRTEADPWVQAKKSFE